jgi:hypothetical protein
MLALDAMNGQAPEVYVVLTTRSTIQDPAAYYNGRRELVRELRRDFGSIEYACLVEFSTGRGPLAGGRRRPHWNLLLKGVTTDDVPRVRAVVERTWCQLEDADPKAQHVGPVHAIGGLMRYLALHFQKEDQSPPEGWKGQRFNCSRGYFDGMTRAEARAEAQDSLFEKRALWRAQRDGLEGDEAEDRVDLAWDRRFTTSWRLYDPGSYDKRQAAAVEAAQGAPVRSEDPSGAGGHPRLADQPGEGSEAQAESTVPPTPASWSWWSSTREEVSNGRCDPGPVHVPELRPDRAEPG